MSFKAFAKYAALLTMALLIALSFPRGIAGEPGETQTQEPDTELVSVPCGDAERIIVERAMRLAFLGSPDGSASWTPRYSFYACNSKKKYEAGVAENSMPYSRSALFNDTEFRGMQQYVGWVDADSGKTPSYAYSITNFLRLANTPNSAFDLAAKAATAQQANWGALLGSDCSAFLSYAWQIPHMTTYMFTSDAVQWNICRIVPATLEHEGDYTYEDLLALEPGDAMICANRSGTDEHGNPLYRGHCVIITDIKLDASGKPAEIDTVEEISPRAIAKHRTAEEFLEYANKFHSSGAYFKFYRLVSKRHLKLEIELLYDVSGGDPIPEDKSVAIVFAMDARGYVCTYDEAISFVPTREGYEFVGWGLYERGNDVIAPGTRIELLRDHTLYARWKTA